MTIHIAGELELDLQRGVVYFHDNRGVTRLRICRLHPPQGVEIQQIDITAPERVMYVTETEETHGRRTTFIQ